MNPIDPVLEEAEDGISITYRSSRLYAKNNPKYSATRRALRISVQDDTLVFVPSPLLFYGLPELLENTGDNVFFLCVEHDESLMALSLEHADRAIYQSNRVLYIRADDPYRAVSTFIESRPWTYHRVMQISLTGGYKLFTGFYDNVREILEQHNQQHWQNRLTLTRMARMWMRNIFQNIALFETRTLPYAPALTLPAVVAGAGPSLERAIPWISAHRSKLLLVCVDTAFGTISDADLTPDVLIVLEGQLANYRDFLPDRRRYIAENTVVLADISSSPTVLRTLGTAPLFFRSEFFDSRVFQRMALGGLSVKPAPPLGSVGTLAILLAKQISTGPAILAGLDFSYQIGKSHAAGSPSHLGTLIRQDRVSPTESISVEHISRRPVRFVGRSGATVHSDIVLKSYSNAVGAIADRYGEVFDTNVHSILDGIEVLDGAAIDAVFSSEKQIIENPLERLRIHDDEFSSDGRRDFLQHEVELISSTRITCADILAGKSTLSGNEETILNADYLYLDFPDIESILFDDPGVLGRIAASTLYYESVLSRAIEMYKSY